MLFIRSTASSFLPTTEKMLQASSVTLPQILISLHPERILSICSDASMHNENGAWQMIFGVNTIPSCRRKGYAGQLLEVMIEDARKQGRKGVILTCKEEKIHYYAKFGFVDEGVSEESTHGGAVWHQMRVTF